MPQRLQETTASQSSQTVTGEAPRRPTRMKRLVFSSWFFAMSLSSSGESTRNFGFSPAPKAASSFNLDLLVVLGIGALVAAVLVWTWGQLKRERLRQEAMRAKSGSGYDAPPGNT